MFTVVNNAFQALEATEHTDFDAIFVDDHLKQLHAYDLLLILRSVGASLPVILLTPRKMDGLPEAKGLPATGLEKPSYHFSSVLQTPYSCQELCSMIHNIFFRKSGGMEASDAHDHQSSERDDVQPIHSHPFDTPFSPFPYALSNTNTNTNTNSGTLDGAHLMELYNPSCYDDLHTGTSCTSSTGSAAQLQPAFCSSQHRSAFNPFARAAHVH